MTPIITVTEYLRYRQKAEDDNAELKKRIELAIDGVSALWEKQCNRTFIAPAAAITEIFDGNGLDRYYPRKGRVEESSTPLLYYRNNTTWTAFSGTLEVDDRRHIVVMLYGLVFDKGRRNWKITYIPGWTLANRPQDLILAVCEHVGFVLDAEKAGLGRPSVSFADTTASYDYRTLPDRVRQVMELYTNHSYGV